MAMANERLDRFVGLLKEIFELDKSDLDFGIYRIMNIRKNKIEDFLTNGLPSMVAETLSPFAGDNSAVLNRMKEIEQQCAAIGIEVSQSSVLAAEYEKLKQQRAAGTDLSGLETDVYSALYTFFSRYYEEGDFISKRRYKEGVYAIPYEGEEVKLYWANQDQYYIKTSENFQDYTFIEQGVTVHFRLVDATQEQNNNKESDDNKRVFMLYTESEDAPDVHTFEYDAEKRELIIRFVFDIPEDKKKKYAEANYAAITDYIVHNCTDLTGILLRDISTDPKKPQTVLSKHLTAYVAKNTFDYFIHKDLGGFLRRELDFYIKTEVMHLDDLDTDNERSVETYLAKIKAMKRVGGIIIDFLAQIEDFQKKLWLKKKFVVDTDWCLTLDNIDEAFYLEIIANRAQIAEWISMYAIDGAEGWTNPPTADFLRKNPHLVVDTRHFSRAFRDRLIESIDGLDEKTNGLMCWGDNYHALNLLDTQYQHGIDCIYADPPYNAKSSEILYKNNYKHSSWISMMDGRVCIALKFLNKHAAHIIAIDDNEVSNILSYLKLIHSEYHDDCISIVHNPAGVQGDNFSYSHEYAIYTYLDDKYMIGKTSREEDSEEAFRDWGGTCSRSLAKNCFYPIYVSGDRIIGFGDVCAEDFHPGTANIVENNRIAVYPVAEDGEERKWVFARDTVETILGNLHPTTKNGIISIKRTKSETSYKTVWTDKRYYANIYGSKLLNHIMGMKLFDFPKSVFTVQDCLYALNSVRKDDAIILDYFAGSGTTGHAVLNLNRADGGNRKYILVEMGNYFHAVTLPRMKKVVYSPDWKDGKPVCRDKGISQIIKVIRLESYEDALSNVELDTAQGDLLSGLFGNKYLIHYMLGTESRDSLLNIAAFRDPFAYRMKITENNEAKLRPVDVVETFNYLIGLSVICQSKTEYYRAEPDGKGTYENAVRLVPDVNGDFAFRRIEGTLPDGRRTLVIWRNITDDILRSNAALDAYFTSCRLNPADREYDVIYVNGDNNLENIRSDGEMWKVVMTETEFKDRMFEEE